MPSYHSSLNEKTGKVVCSMTILPIKTKVRGPAPRGVEGEEDIIDEAIKFFRANVLFASFDVKGGADRVLIFLTLFLSQCIKRLEKAKSKDEGVKLMFQLAKESFPLPGESGWALGGHIAAPKDRSETDSARSYLSQLREEASTRMVERCFNGDGTPNKWWMSFSKRKFMNITVR